MDSSGGSSLVVYRQFAFQKFRCLDVSERIVDMLKRCEKNIIYPILFQKGFGKGKEVLFKHTLCYNMFCYVVPYLCFFKKYGVIVWRRVVPLNRLSYGLSTEFLEKNFLKIWYDISKALLALRKNNIFHNDTVLDNIGIYNNNFILFDFDGSKNSPHGCDYKRLKKSFHFYGVEMSVDIEGLYSLIEYVSEMKKISLSDSFYFLESLQIDY